MISPDEREKLLTAFNATHVEYPGAKTVVDPPHTTKNNYARDTMLIYRTTYGDNVYPSSSNVTLNATLTGNDGQTTTDSTFRDSYFWQTALGFDPAVWDLDKVWSLGYPLLRNVGGQ